MTRSRMLVRWTIQLVTPLACIALAPAVSDASPPQPTGTPAPQTPAQTRAQHAHCAHHPAPVAAEPLPGQSLYNLRVSLTDQHGAALGLDAFRGHPVVITMFYASCTTICPMLIEQVKAIDAELAPELRADTRFLLVSLDPDHDSVARLAELATTHGIHDGRWHFARTSESGVRDTAALLGIRYRRMSDGSISHSPLIALLDRDGVLVLRTQGGAADTAEISAALAR